MKKEIRIRFCNGLSFEQDKQNILAVVADLYHFVESATPDFILFGPYGNDIPPPGPYTRIGYFCENIVPDMESCEWAFGIPLAATVQHPNYQRIQWHGLDPASLVKHMTENQVDELCSRQKFCNFLYSNPVPYREEFFRQLSKYKRVDAPGASMNNMPSIDLPGKGGRRQQKMQFLAQYKFTISFENYCYPGYQTEKLYDAMTACSLPIYCGDPCITGLFNPQSFFNLDTAGKVSSSPLLDAVEKLSQPGFKDILPQFYTSPIYRVRRKLKAWGRQFKMDRVVSKAAINHLVEQVVQADRDPSRYAQYLRAPWFYGNTVPEQVSSRSRWQQIFG